MDKEKKPKKKRRYLRLLILFWLAVLSPFIGLGLMLFFISQGIFFEELPSFDQLENPVSSQATVILSSDQKTLGKYYRENRNDVRFDDLSPYVVTALICTEDERYHEHSGIDLRGLARAIANGGGKGGASTITQQLAKMLFHNQPGGKLDRVIQKLKEWIIAVRLERQYTKEEILTMYLNKFDWIHNAVGIKSAAQVYFDKLPVDLEIHEAATLVGMAKNPSLFDPIKRPDTTLHRRNVVLGQMLRNQAITQTEFDSIRELPLGLDYHLVDHKVGLAPHFREELRKELKKILTAKNDDGSYRIAKANGDPYDIYGDGLRVYTTIDTRMQEYAEWAMQEYLGGKLQEDFFRDLKKNRRPPFSNRVSETQVERLMKRARESSKRYQTASGKECPNCGRRGKYLGQETIEGVDYHTCNADDCGFKHIAVGEDSIQRSFDTPVPMRVFAWGGDVDTVMSPNDSIRYYKSFLRSGFMAMDPHTGFIKAWVGGTDFGYFSFDHVRNAKRQVGSTIKPFVYAKALMKGFEPCSRVPNIKQIFTLPDGKKWSPGNADGKYGDVVSLRFGLANSLNPVTAYLFKQYDTGGFIRFLRQAGISAKMDTVPSLCLGVPEISLMELVGAYSIFANKGNYLEPTFITRIEDKDGQVLMQNRAITRAVIDERLAYTMLDMMKGVTGYVRNELGERKAGTGIRIRSAVSEARPYTGFKYPLAAKTGTTQNNSDGWFVGITPDLIAGCWVGAENRSISFRTTYNGQGANTALPIYGYFMQKVYADKTIDISRKDFDKPDGFRLESDCQEVNRLIEEPNWDEEF